MQKAQERKELSGGRAVVISIHDVSPLTWKRTEVILNDLKIAGVGRVSLLVIPDHHGRGLVSAEKDFAAWIKAQSAQGHEIVLHGYHHLRESRREDGVFKRLVTRSYTAGEGEFFDLAKPEATRLLDLGRASLDACGVSCTGFIAPAWLLGEGAEAAVRDAGFEYTTRISTVVDFVTGAVHRSRSQVWSVRAAWRRSCSLVWNRLLFQMTANRPLTRIGIHPPDWDHPRIREQILQIARNALAGREARTYEGWLARTRADQ
jgi:predicted deacetylase